MFVIFLFASLRDIPFLGYIAGQGDDSGYARRVPIDRNGVGRLVQNSEARSETRLSVESGPKGGALKTSCQRQIQTHRRNINYITLTVARKHHHSLLTYSAFDKRFLNSESCMILEVCCRKVCSYTAQRKSNLKMTNQWQP